MFTDKDCVYPGHNEEIKLQEYEQLKSIINERHKCSLTALEVRSEFERAYNKIFEHMLVDYSDKVYEILFVLMDTFNIDEVKAVRYLYPKNREIVKAYAINKDGDKVYYIQNMEKERLKEKYKEKGKKFFDHNTIKDLFE